jgi:hypothetical protein
LEALLIDLAGALLASILASFLLGYLTSNRRLIIIGSAFAAMIALLMLGWVSDWPPPDIRVVIDQPKDGAEVGQRALVAGKSTPVPRAIYVLVRARSTTTWWVQDLPGIDGEGNWSVKAYFGTTGLGLGETFDIIAVATSENSLTRVLRGVNLSAGQQFSTLVPSLAKSSLVVVKRTH